VLEMLEKVMDLMEMSKKKHQIHLFEVQFADGLNWHERWKLPDFIGIFHLNFIISMKPSWTLSGASYPMGHLEGYLVAYL